MKYNLEGWVLCPDGWWERRRVSCVHLDVLTEQTAASALGPETATGERQKSDALDKGYDLSVGQSAKVGSWFGLQAEIQTTPISAVR